MSDSLRIECVLLKSSGNGLKLYQKSTDVETWIPYKYLQETHYAEDGEVNAITIPAWLADHRELK